MPTTLVLVRHGQTIHNTEGKVAGWTDSPLSDIGREQAEKLAQHVAGRYHLAAIYSSPLQRALYTAERIGAFCLGASSGNGKLKVGQTSVVIREDLKELNFGELENHTETEISQKYPGIWAASQTIDDETFQWPGGEMRSEFYRRVMAAIDDIANSHPNEAVAIVSHGGVLGAYISGIIEGQPHYWRKYLVKNCSITEVTVENGDPENKSGRATIVCLNDHAHLPDYGVDAFLESLAAEESGARNE